MERAARDGDEVRMWEHDRRFHRTILEATGNKRLAEFIDGMRDMVVKRGVSTAESSRTMLDIVAEHTLGFLSGWKHGTRRERPTRCARTFRPRQNCSWHRRLGTVSMST